MADRKKLEIQLNQPCSVELLFDQPTIGQSQYGEYYLYAVRNGDGQTEYSYFAPPEVHDKLKDLKKGDRATILKLAEQKGSKIITRYEVSVEKTKQSSEAIVQTTASDNLYQLMRASCLEAVQIQNELGAMPDSTKSIALALYISRTKINSFGG